MTILELFGKIMSIGEGVRNADLRGIVSVFSGADRGGYLCVDCGNGYQEKIMPGLLQDRITAWRAFVERAPRAGLRQVFYHEGPPGYYSDKILPG